MENMMGVLRVFLSLFIIIILSAHQIISTCDAFKVPQSSNDDAETSLIKSSGSVNRNAINFTHNELFRGSPCCNSTEPLTRREQLDMHLQQWLYKQQQQQQLEQEDERAELDGLQEEQKREIALVRALVTRSGQAERGKEEEQPVITSSFNADDEKQLAASHVVFYTFKELHNKMSVAEWLRAGLIVLTQSSVYSAFYLHRYDNYEDMKRASGPRVDNELCVQQLANIAERAERLRQDKYYTRDVNMHTLLDTWGHVSSGVFLGKLFTEGAYTECTKFKLQMPAESGTQSSASIDTRYCVLSIRHKSWQRADKHDVLNLKSSVCIPKTCDSSNYKNKFELIQRIMQSQARTMEADEFRVNNMYCLPDEDSSLRAIRNSPRAVTALACFSAWFLFIAFATYKQHALEKILKVQEKSDEEGVATNGNQRVQLKLYKMFSITNNFRLLFDTSKESSLMETAKATKGRGSAEAKVEGDKGTTTPTTTTESTTGDINEESQQKQQVAPAESSQSVESSAKLVDLRCIEGIKVIAMCYVIIGHVLMCMPTILANGAELAKTSSAVFFLANLVPAFAVNSFFTITGTLTCYLMFKQNKSQPVIRRPSNWVAFIMYRYLRIMPMYALVVLYCKTLAKYTGSGPFWDYGTSALGQRATCEQEPWHWTLLFISNYLPPMQHCIPGGWYLSNDFQFFLVTPFLMVVLERSPRLGKALLKCLIVAGYLLGVHSLYSSQVSDLRPIAVFAPHGFKTYVSHFSFNYTYPQYRIPAYLIGLLVGYKLFQYEEDRRRFYEKKAKRQQLEEAGAQNDDATTTATTNETPPDWSDTFKRRAAFWSVFLVILCCCVPFIGSNLPNVNKTRARALVAFFTPTCHIQFSVAVGMFIMLATTGNGNKYLAGFLSASFWKPLSRLSLCAVLVNVEVINYIIQTSTSQYSTSNQFHTMLNMFCILSTYVVATIVCVLFEAPIRAALNATLAHIIARLTRKQKTN